MPEADSYLRLLHQQQVVRMYDAFLAADIVFKVLFSSFYRNFRISNVAEHYPRV
jgi:hypothetical protein